MLLFFIIVLDLSILGFGVYALIREPQITGYYEACQIYNRVYAFFAAGIVVGGTINILSFPVIVFFALSDIRASFTGSEDSVSFVEIVQALSQALSEAISANPAEFIKTIIGIIWTIIVYVIGIYMYYRVYRKSPDFLKKRCLIDLTISGCGIMFRLLLWFIRLFVETWWELNKPEVYVLKSGRSVYAFPDGHVYDASNSKFGKMTDDKTAVIWDS